MSHRSSSQPVDDVLLAETVTRRAAEVLRDLRRHLGFGDAARLREEGDRRSNRLIGALLSEHRPGDAVLSEESPDDLARLAARRVWIVDPLDGTREFAEPGRDDWAVHVALWEDGRLTAAAVALPARDRIWSSRTVAPPPARGGGRLRVAVSRTRAPASMLAVCDRLAAEVVEMGSAGAKTMAVVEGTVDAYAHDGGQYEWDSAAPVGVALAAGLHASRLDGSPLAYNRPDPRLPDLLVCRRELAGDLLAAAAARP